MATTYSLAEVENHKSKGDLWLVIHGKVYDVSKFVEDVSNSILIQSNHFTDKTLIAPRR